MLIYIVSNIHRKRSLPPLAALPAFEAVAAYLMEQAQPD